MRFDWILLSPAGPYAALAIGLMLLLFLFVTLKRDMRIGENRWRNKLVELQAVWDEKTAALDRRIEELSQISGVLVPPAPPRSGLNLTKRSQALQMNRRGATAPEIAATLALPQNEVDLLLKVQQIVHPPAQAARTAGT